MASSRRRGFQHPRAFVEEPSGDDRHPQRGRVVCWRKTRRSARSATLARTGAVMSPSMGHPLTASSALDRIHALAVPPKRLHLQFHFLDQVPANEAATTAGLPAGWLRDGLQLFARCLRGWNRLELLDLLPDQHRVDPRQITQNNARRVRSEPSKTLNVSPIP